MQAKLRISRTPRTTTAIPQFSPIRSQSSFVRISTERRGMRRLQASPSRLSAPPANDAKIPGACGRSAVCQPSQVSRNHSRATRWVSWWKTAGESSLAHLFVSSERLARILPPSRRSPGSGRMNCRASAESPVAGPHATRKAMVSAIADTPGVRPGSLYSQMTSSSRETVVYTVLSRRPAESESDAARSCLALLTLKSDRYSEAAGARIRSPCGRRPVRRRPCSTGPAT